MQKKSLHNIIHERILVLDGALGTMIQGCGLTETDFRGERFAAWEVPLAGCNDILAITAPHVIRRIHEAYLEAGADIISTDSFNATAVSLADYRLEDYAYEINLAAARVARATADEATLSDPSKPRFVAGSMGPTNRTASMSADVNDPASREVTFDDLAAAYHDQARGLLDGGADILLLETVFDTLNAKACIYAVEKECARRGVRVPVMLSGTLADASGRTLSGQTVEAFYASVGYTRPLAVGFNCAYGARQMRPYLARLASVCEFAVSAHPNAGLPNVMGGYDETPEMMAADIEEYLKEGLVNIVGGCCGTTPAHIEAIARAAAKYEPRPLPASAHETVLSGLEPLRITRETNFVNIGERANVAGSAKFARLVREGNWDEAVAIARQQVEAGAQIVDVCMDDGLIDGAAAMTHFLNLATAEPEIARVPFMIDSSSWEVLEAGLKCVQGKSIVNSISLKDGEQEFVRRAEAVRVYGAAAVVMLFDERGQADTFARKIEVAQRAYDILTSIGFPPEDIVFDPNVLSVATGIEEHDNYAVDFIEAVRWIKASLPYAKVSGGVSNLSFAFRGNNAIREAMHSVFLYHAIAAGMDMGIVNPAMLQVYSDIEPELLELAEDVVLNRRRDAAERMAAYAGRIREAGGGEAITAPSAQKWRGEPVKERIAYAMTKGMTDHVEQDILEAYGQLGNPLAVIDTMLMPAMSRIGELFGEGKMFLPQVVKSARVMRQAVGVLTPYIEQSGGERQDAGRILIATVKGDVHDIGKNIVSVVMSCNGYKVHDLGVMVESGRIADEAQRINVQVIGLSGLISPSLDEMGKVVAELERRGLKIPVIIGGATTSDLHTAVKIAPRYSGAVIHSNDASENIAILNKLLGLEREAFIEDIRRRQAGLRERYEQRMRETTLVPLAAARANRRVKSAQSIVAPLQTGRIAFKDFPIGDVVEYIDWSFFFAAWGIRGRFPELLGDPQKGAEARRLYDEARAMLAKIEAEKSLTLNAVAGIYPARRDGDDIILTDSDGREFRLPQLRNQESGRAWNPSLADYVAPGGHKGGVDGKAELSGLAMQDRRPAAAPCGGLCAALTDPPPATGRKAITANSSKLQNYHDGDSCGNIENIHGSAESHSDYIGAFALTAGVGLDRLTENLHAAGDQYGAIMCKLLADRLTEAFSEVLHIFVRRRMWGYETGAPMSPQQVIKGDYQGIRVAFGYPACPDHSLKKDVFELLGATRETSMTITENYMIHPGEALCGLMFADADAEYFSVGRIDSHQLEDYAARREMPAEEIARLIPHNLK